MLLTCAAAAPCFAADFVGLADKVTAAGAQDGVTRYALEEFSAEGGASPAEAEQARRNFAEELLTRPGVGAMDITVLSAIAAGKPWPQAVLAGSLYGTGDNRTLVVRLNDLRGRRVAIWQVDLPAGRSPADLRDAPGALTPCEKLRREVAAENRETVDLKARYWAGRVRSPGFSYRSLERAPGSEIKEYGAIQRFYKLMNDYYNQDGPVRVTPPEKNRLELLFKKEADFSAKCGGRKP